MEAITKVDHSRPWLSTDSTHAPSTRDLQAALDALILAEAPPAVGADEFTVQSLAERAQVDRGRSKKMIRKWLEDGRIEAVGKRRGVQGHIVDAWKVKV